VLKLSYWDDPTELLEPVIAREPFCQGELLVLTPHLPDPESADDLAAAMRAHAALDAIGMGMWAVYVIMAGLRTKRSGATRQFDVARECYIARLSRRRIVARKVSGEKESMETEDGETRRSADTGDQYGSGIHLGSGPGWMPTHTLSTPDNLVSEVVRESSPFGTCLRAQALNSSMCSLEQGGRCRSYREMLPSDILVPVALGGGTQRGRTTSLERVAPDRTQWVVR
jgi:hypothetical protein